MLEVRIVRNNGTIDFNFEDIKDALASELELYKNLVFTEDTKADAKKTVAELRKLKKQISDKRIEVKKLYMQPYTDFEAKVKELDKLINEPIAYISEQIDAFEQKRIEEKRELINSIYLELVSGREDIAGYAELNRVYDSKWENTSTSKKTIQESITNYLDGVTNDIAAIKSMESEYETKALMRYKETGVLSDALLTIRQWEKQKEEILKAEEEKQAEAEADEILDAPEPIEEFIEPTEKNDIMKMARYEVKVDPFQQAQLECYMQECGIQYRRLD
nr:MAG TPA: Protein of unknown function (DUF1351) [Caudoviricetes sp.]